MKFVKVFHFSFAILIWSTLVSEFSTKKVCKFCNGRRYSKPDYVAHTNGCGVKGMKLQTHSEIEKCCDEHDYCYSDCEKTKKQCDKLFKQCMDRKCLIIGKEVKVRETSIYVSALALKWFPFRRDGIWDQLIELISSYISQTIFGKFLIPFINSHSLPDCYGLTQMIHQGTMLLGCPAYLDAQAEACQCISNDGTRKRTNYFFVVLLGIMGGKSSKQHTLSNEEIDFLAKNTGKSVSEVREWYIQFINENPGGFLTKKSFIKAYRDFYPSSKVDKVSALVFGAFDGDNSGKIDFTEFLTSIAMNTTGSSQEKLRFGFKIHDCNDDGFIDKKEMTKVVKAILDLSGESQKGSKSAKNRVEEIFKIMDADSNKKLNVQEFIRGVSSDKELESLLMPIE
ncbi:hypothetical protein SNEBB_001368 [Seison nebaliae]|nr:hypothetical protein SNEBB_001368 [Seison nebaliae]